LARNGLVAVRREGTVELLSDTARQWYHYIQGILGDIALIHGLADPSWRPWLYGESTFGDHNVFLLKAT